MWDRIQKLDFEFTEKLVYCLIIKRFLRSRTMYINMILTFY